MPNVSFDLILEARNYARVRNALEVMASKAWYRGIIRDTAHEVLEDWAIYAKRVTHKLTGLLSQSIIWSYDSHRQQGRVYINPRSVSKRGRSTVVWPKIYGPYEHARGGDHAFFERTISARGYRALEAGFKALDRGVPKV